MKVKHSKIITIFICIFLFILSFNINISANTIAAPGVYQDNASWSYPDEASIFLDGIKVNNRGTCYEVGYHELKVVYSDGSSKVFNFTIETSIVYTEMYDKYYINGVNEHQQVYLDDVQKFEDFTIEIAGIYELKIVGSNNYEKIVQLKLEPQLTITKRNGHNYVTANTSFIELNGEKVESNIVVDELGVNVVAIYDLEGNRIEQTIRNFSFNINNYAFSIETFESMKTHIDNKEYNYSYLVKKLPTKMFIDGKEIFEDTYVYEPGKHKITIEINNHQTSTSHILEYEFTVINYNYTFSTIISIIFIVILIAAIFILSERRRVK